MSDKIIGFGTKADGSPVQFTETEVRALLKACDEEKQKRAVDMPTAQDALAAISRSTTRLRDLGWKDAIYCPKDGSTFAVIEYGSTGIFTGLYSGDWHDGRIYLDDFLVHPNGCMFKLLDDLSEDEKARLAECDQETRAQIEREFRAAEDITNG